MPGDVGVRCFISFPHMWSSAQVSLKLRTITKFKLQNWTYKQFRLLEKCSFVQFGHMWYFERLQKAFVEYDGSVIANCVPREPFLINRFVGVLPWEIKPLGEHLRLLGWSFWEKVTVLSISHCTFPPLLGPRCRAVGSSGGVSSNENVQFYFYRTSHCLTFLCDLLLESTTHFDIDTYKKNNKVHPTRCSPCLFVLWRHRV